SMLPLQSHRSHVFSLFIAYPSTHLSQRRPVLGRGGVRWVGTGIPSTGDANSARWADWIGSDTSVALGTVETGHCLVGQNRALAPVRAGTQGTVLLGALQCVSIVAGRAPLTGVTGRVMSAATATFTKNQNQIQDP